MRALLEYIGENSLLIFAAASVRSVIDWKKYRKTHVRTMDRAKIVSFIKRQGINFFISSTLAIVVGYAVKHSKWQELDLVMAVITALIGDRLIPLLMNKLNKYTI
jgi:hypothetical protein